MRGARSSRRPGTLAFSPVLRRRLPWLLVPRRTRGACYSIRATGGISGDTRGRSRGGRDREVSGRVPGQQDVPSAEAMETTSIPAGLVGFGWVDTSDLPQGGLSCAGWGGDSFHGEVVSSIGTVGTYECHSASSIACGALVRYEGRRKLRFSPLGRPAPFGELPVVQGGFAHAGVRASHEPHHAAQVHGSQNRCPSTRTKRVPATAGAVEFAGS